MIGQHIYSRCLEGYFSKSGLNADSTTVTISMNMFARMEQAKLVAKEKGYIYVDTGAMYRGLAVHFLKKECEKLK